MQEAVASQERRLTHDGYTDSAGYESQESDDRHSGQMEKSASREGRPRARPVRHRPQQQSNEIADYIEQSLHALPAHSEKATPPARRRKPKKRKDVCVHAQRGDDADPPSLLGDTAARPKCVRDVNVVEVDELDDSDEYEEIVADLTADFKQFGDLQSLVLSRETGELTLQYAGESHAMAAATAKHAQLYGGRQLVAHLLEQPSTQGPSMTAKPVAVKETAPTAPSTEATTSRKTRKRRSKIKNAVIKAQELREREDPLMGRSRLAFTVQNMVDAAEVEDDDEYEEILEDTTTTFRQYGAIASLSIVRIATEERLTPGEITVEFVTAHDAESAFTAVDGKTFGGRVVRCVWPKPESTSGGDGVQVVVDGLLDAEELEDDDEFADIQQETQVFFSKDHGVHSVTISRSTGQVRVVFDTHDNAVAATERLQQTTYGGRLLKARLDTTPAPSSVDPVPVQSNAIKSSTIEKLLRPQVSDVLNELLKTFLQRLASLQERAHVQNPLHDKRSRRLVLGLHEVRRGLTSHKIKLLLVATDLDECDVLDGKLSDILSLATRENIPIVCAMTRRKLGRVLKKHARVSCVGVYSFDGANDSFREILHEQQRLERLHVP